LERVSIEEIKADFTSISRTRNPPIIDETGDRKKGDTTDYVKRQYIEFRKIENG